MTCAAFFSICWTTLWRQPAQTEQGEILCSMQIRRQYLAIRCENTYSGTLRTDKNGELLTAKDDASDHGFGLMKMRAIAKKYGSVLDISYDENRFTVMTALKLLPGKEKSVNDKAAKNAASSKRRCRFFTGKIKCIQFWLRYRTN